MTDGIPSSGLSFTAATDILWSRRRGGGAPYDYTPSPDATGFDPLVTGMHIKPRGQLAGGTTEAPSSPTFTLKARVK